MVDGVSSYSAEISMEFASEEASNSAAELYFCVREIPGPSEDPNAEIIAQKTTELEELNAQMTTGTATLATLNTELTTLNNDDNATQEQKDEKQSEIDS